jgi:hypothetical protein
MHLIAARNRLIKQGVRNPISITIPPELSFPQPGDRIDSQT